MRLTDYNQELRTRASFCWPPLKILFWQGSFRNDFILFFLDVILFATFNHFEKLTILGHQKLCSTDWPGATIKYLTAFFCLDSTIDRKKIENNIFLLNVARFSETLYDKTWVVFPLVMTTNLYLDRGDIVYYLKVEHS